MKQFAIEQIIPGNRDTAPAGTFFKDFVEDAEIIGSTIQIGCTCFMLSKPSEL